MQTVDQHFEEQLNPSNAVWHLGAGLALFIGLDLSEADPEKLKQLRGVKRYTFIPRQIAREYHHRLRTVGREIRDSLEQANQRVSDHDPQRQLYEDTARFRFYKAAGSVGSVLMSVIDFSFFNPNKAISARPKRNEEVPVREKVWGGTFLGNAIRCRTTLWSDADGSPPKADNAVSPCDPSRHIDDVLEVHVQIVPPLPASMMVSELGFFRSGLQSIRQHHLT